MSELRSRGGAVWRAGLLLIGILLVGAAVEDAEAARRRPPPAHDDWSGAVVATPGFHFASFLFATNDGGASCGNSGSKPDLWYSYTAAVAGTLVVDTCGTHDLAGTDTGTNTVLSLHTGGPGTAANELTCNDDWVDSLDLPLACDGIDAGAALDSVVERSLAAGETVLIRVAHSGGFPTPPSVFLLHAVFSATDPNGDADGDALLDDWEISGYDHDGDGAVDVDLPALGADPLRKDIFVECDYMEGGSPFHSHLPDPVAVQRAKDAYADAPVPNPDGSTGITFHVKVDDLVAHDNDLNPVSNQFNAIKAVFFDPKHAPIYHYCLFAHRYSGSTSSGLSFGIPASDFIVSMGAFPGQTGTEQQQAGTLMHELGHNLGLGHGGSDGTNYKTNYLSLMSYHYQLRGLYYDGQYELLDYSRFLIEDLIEFDLDESVGLDVVGGDAQLADYGARYFDSGGALRLAAPATGAVDWSGTGGIQSSVSVDLNDDSFIGVLFGASDWDALVYDGGAVGAPGSGEGEASASSIAVPTECATPDELLLIPIPFDE